MSEEKQYRVLRRHEADRLYEEGETRSARQSDVRHLVGSILEPLTEATGADRGDELEGKAEAAPLNKAEGASPANKAESQRRTKAKEPDTATTGAERAAPKEK